MSNIVTYHNILQPLNREVIQTTARNKQEALAELKYDPIAYELIISKNGIVTKDDFDIVEGDIVAVQIVPRGGGGGLLKMVAMIAVSVLAPMAGLAALNAIGATTALTWGGAMAIQYGVTALAMVGGAMLVNAILPPPTPSLSDFGMDALQNSPTYGWDTRGNPAVQGSVIPKVFGKHKVTPPLVGKYVESINDKQYLNMLFAVHDGQIKNLTDIRINDEPIENFDNVQIDIRYGVTNQTTIPWFNDTRRDKNVSQKLSTDFDIATTDDDTVTEITAVLSFPRGLYYMTDKGNVATSSVQVVVEYSSDGVNWLPMYSADQINSYSEYYRDLSDEYFTRYARYNSGGVLLGHVKSLPSGVVAIPNNTNTPIGKSYLLNPVYGLPLSYSAPYETISGATTSAFRRTFTRKNLTPARYEIRARLYSTPPSSTRYGNDVWFEYLEEAIADDFEYPKTALLAVRALATDQLSGNLPTVTCVVEANSDNPAEAIESILLEDDPTADIDSVSFTEFKNVCTNNNYKVNIVFDSPMSMRQTIDTISLLGRANIQQFGSKHVAIMDKYETLPVQTFTFGLGNIMKDTLNITYLPLADRANVIEVTYYDETKNYERTVVEVSNVNYDSVVERKVAQLNLIGCTNREQAMKLAKYQLNCNRYISETCTFQADKDSLVCKYGDLVAVSQDVLQYGYSGRIVDIDGLVITLDREVTFDVGTTYGIKLRNINNEIEEVQVTGTGTTNTVTAVSLNYTYQKYDNYMFGEVDKTSKLYRVAKISTYDDFTRLLTLIEYNEDVYNDSVVIDVPQISDLGLKSLYISDYIRYQSTSIEIETVVNLKWTGVSLYYDVSWKKSSDTQWETKRVYETFTEIVGVESGTDYDFIVRDNFGKQLTQTYHVLGKFAPPPKVENLTYSLDCDEISISWNYNDKPIDFKEFQFIRNDVLLGATTTNNIILPIDSQRLTYSVFAMDSSNIYSDISNLIIDIPYLDDVTGFTSFWNKNGEIELTWNLISASCNPIQYEIRKGDSWNNAQVVALTYDKFYKPQGQGVYHIKARHTNIYGYANYSQNALSLNLTGENFVRNVIAELDEKLDGWQGDKVDVIVYNDSIFDNCIALSPNDNNFDLVENVDTIANIDYINGSVLSGVYTIPTDSIVDIGQSSRCGIIIDYTLQGIDLNDNIDLVQDFDLLVNVDGDYGSIISCTPQIQIDGGSWQNYIAGDYVGQTFNFRLLIDTLDNTIIPVVCDFKISVDVPDKVLTLTNISIPASTTAITYTDPFNTDNTNIQVTILNAVEGDTIVITNETKTGFDLAIKNGGVFVARNVNIFVQAY